MTTNTELIAERDALQAQLAAAQNDLAAQQAQPERAPLSDAEITQLMSDWGVVTTKHRTDNGAPFQSVELSFDRLSALLRAAHGIKQGGQHD